jgi:hypothetical protein
MIASEEKTGMKASTVSNTGPADSPHKPWLDFGSTLIWQLIVIGILLYFRRQLSDLFTKIASAKFAGVEVLLQSPSADAKRIGGEAEKELTLIGRGGFFTPDGITSIIENSGLAEPGEKIRHRILLFQTSKQRTWLAASDHRLFCVLDDETMRTSGKLVQWILRREDATPVTARATRERVGTVGIGPRKRWLYSTRLHPSPDGLRSTINALFEP